MTGAVAGLDVGGTKTHVRVVDRQGRTLRDRVVPTSDWARRSDEERGRALADLVTEHVLPLGASAVVAGVHGCDSEYQRQALETPLRAVVARSAVVNDAELVVPAAGYDSGTGVIAGTGACATSRDAGGRAFSVGGWGWVLGDEGSAAAIVRDAAREVLRAWDEHREDPLTDVLLSRFDLGHPHQLGWFLTSEAPEVWASAASEVFAAETQGSAAAAAVLDKQLAGLLNLLRAVDRRGGDLSVVALAGGVFTGQPVYAARFAEGAQEVAGEAEVVVLAAPPVVGAVRLASRLP